MKKFRSTKKIKQRFCKHVYPINWQVKYEKTPEVWFYRKCEKCGKMEMFLVPMTDLDKPYQEYMKRKKHWLA